MNQNGEKIVDFHYWCPKCTEFERPEDEDPCRECLENSVNTYSTKPVYWKEATKSVGQ